MYTNWQIVDSQNNEVIVDRLLDLTQANETLQILKSQNPHREYEIIETEESSVKPGFGRDPDLH